MNIILSAYSCLPGSGSEPGVGWNWLFEISKNNNVYCLFYSGDGQKEMVEKALNLISHRSNINLIPLDIPNYYHIFFYRIRYEIWQIIAYFEAKKILKKVKIDLIHHVTIATWWNCGYLWKLKIPFFFGPISGGQKVPFKTFYFLPLKAKIYEIFRRIMIKVLFTLRRSYKKVIQNSKVVFTANEETNDLLKSLRGNRPLILFNEIGVDSIPKLNLPKIKNSDDSKLNILTVGQIIPRKNHALLIESLNKLNDNIDWQLKIVGDGSLKKFITRKIKKYHLESKIEFIGQVEFKNIDFYYKWADIFIFTSVRDATGTVVLEAMKFGLPVIALDLHGARLVLKNGAGILIPVKNKEQMISDLKDWIVRLYENKGLRTKIGILARKRIEENFVWERRGEKMNQFYQEFLKN